MHKNIDGKLEGDDDVSGINVLQVCYVLILFIYCIFMYPNASHYDNFRPS